MNKHFHAVKCKRLRHLKSPQRASWQTVDALASCHLWHKESFSQSDTDFPLLPSIWKGMTFPPTWKCSNSFQFCWCYCHWLSIRHRVIKEWMRNCVGSAVALIALSEPSGRFFIKGGHKEERGDGWRCSPDKSACTGNHCLVQPGSTNALQFRLGTWQVPMSYRAACTRPQTSLFPRLILYGCTCQGLFVHPWSPSHTQSTVLFSSMPNYFPMISKLFNIFPKLNF